MKASSRQTTARSFPASNNTTTAKSATVATEKSTAKAPAKGTSSWYELGTVRNNAKNNPYIVLNKNVDVFVNGEKVDLGEFRTVKLVDPRLGLETLLSNGKIDESTYNERLEIIDDKRIEYKVTVAPQNN